MGVQNYSVRYNPVLQNVSEVSQYGITWTLDGSYQAGQFVDGSWWVLDPGTGVVVSAVSPTWDGTKNGSMLDPIPNGTAANYQGLDTRAYGYDAAKRQTFPVTIATAGKSISLLSCIGKETQPGGGAHQTLDMAAVLTVVPSIPAADAFRPGFTGGHTKVIHRASDCNFGLLPGLALPVGATLPTGLQGPFVDFGPYGQQGSELHNDGQYDPYPREFSARAGDVALAACTDTANTQVYAKRVIQLGIDLFETMQNNAQGWRAYGGFSMGRKLPIMFAGKLLGVAAMRDLGSPTVVVSGQTIAKFGEDGHSFIGAATATYPSGAPMFGRENLFGEPYFFNHELRDGENNPPLYECDSLPEGVTDVLQMNALPAVYTDDGSYKTTNLTGWLSPMLAALILGLKTAWGHDAFFDLCDRCVDENWSINSNAHPFLTDFGRKMWNDHRGSY